MMAGWMAGRPQATLNPWPAPPRATPQGVGPWQGGVRVRPGGPLCSGAQRGAQQRQREGGVRSCGHDAAVSQVVYGR